MGSERDVEMARSRDSRGSVADALADAPKERQDNGTAAPPADEGAASNDDALGMFLALGK